MRLVKVAVTQMACSEDHAENVDKAENLVREAAVQGANIILLPELFETRYFCCLLYTSPSPRDKRQSRMPSSA